MKSRIKSNLDKEKPLLFAISIALLRLNVKFIPIHHKYNFKNKEKHGVADFALRSALIEAKNWNCIKYWIQLFKAKFEILNRYADTDLAKILIISNPVWKSESKEYLIRNGVIIIELGYMVTWANKDRAIRDLIKKLRPIILTLSKNDNIPLYSILLSLDGILLSLYDTYPKIFPHHSTHKDHYTRLLGVSKYG